MKIIYKSGSTGLGYGNTGNVTQYGNGMMTVGSPGQQGLSNQLANANGSPNNQHQQGQNNVHAETSGCCSCCTCLTQCLWCRS